MAHGPIVAVNGSHTRLGSGYTPKVENVISPIFIAPKTQKWGSIHFHWKYVWLSV